MKGYKRTFIRTPFDELVALCTDSNKYAYQSFDEFDTSWHKVGDAILILSLRYGLPYSIQFGYFIKWSDNHTVK